MTVPTALQQALVAYSRVDPDRQQQIDDAVALQEWGIFSTNHIIAITGLPVGFGKDLLTKSDKKGGRFNPEALPEIFDLWQAWAQGGRDMRLAASIVNKMGVSAGFLSKLTSIPEATIKRWAAAYKEQS